jgi:Xaa-Pro aminopeptidase
MHTIHRLRTLLAQQQLDGYITPHNDQFNGEYLPPHAERLAYLTGFTGSAGLGIVTAAHAALFVDGRYTLQGQQQIDRAFWGVEPLTFTAMEAWLATHAKGLRIGFDPWLFTTQQHATWQGIATRSALTLCPTEGNFIDALWEGRPPATPLHIVEHPLTFAGETAEDKIQQLSNILSKAGVDYWIISCPQSLAWLLNIRAHTVPHTPVVNAFGLWGRDGTVRVFGAVASAPAFITWEDETSLIPALQGLQGTIGYDPATLPYALAEALNHHQTVVMEDPCLNPRARKNATEQQGARGAHIRDGAAVMTFLAWLEERLRSHAVTELEAAEHLYHCRAQQDYFKDTSFQTIAAAGPHGAIVHYQPTPETNTPLLPGLFLLDSGGQYLDGTTDITRTVAIGSSTEEQKQNFTRVLKGHIAIATALFPQGTTGHQLDALARQYLWAAGLDYLHGTGHGVGSYLCVHEGPQRISPRADGVPLQPGMILSNEPGYYKVGEYGIRLENLVLVREHPTYKGFLHFETLTCVPFDLTLMDKTMLTQGEVDWVNTYHSGIYTRFSPIFQTPELLKWLAKATQRL